MQFAKWNNLLLLLGKIPDFASAISIACENVATRFLWLLLPQNALLALAIVGAAAYLIIIFVRRFAFCGFTSACPAVPALPGASFTPRGP